MKRQVTVDDYVEVIASNAKSHIGQRGIVVRDEGPEYDSVCVVLPKLWDHGIWYFRNELKKTYRKRCAK